MTCFQILPPPHSYSIFISSCLEEILAYRLYFKYDIHKGSTIIQMSFNYNLQFTHSECMVDSVMFPSAFYLITPIYLILHMGLSVNLPTLNQNNTLPCLGFCSSIFFTSLRTQTKKKTKKKLFCLLCAEAPCMFFCSLGRWLRVLQSTLCDCPRLSLATKLLIKLQMLRLLSASVNCHCATLSANWAVFN